MSRKTNYVDRYETYSNPNSVTRQFQYKGRESNDIKNPQQGKVYEIENTQFKSATSPILTKEKKIIIEEKLDLERKAALSTAQRIKTDNLFVRYYSNPFIETHDFYKKPSVESLSIGGSETTEDNTNIVAAVNGLRKLPMPTFQNPQFYAFKKQYENISQMNQKLGSFNISQQDKSLRKMENQYLKQISFEDILLIQQKRYIPDKTDNIFKIMNRNHQLTDTKNLLKNHHFHQNSNINYNSNYRLPFEAHLSPGIRRNTSSVQPQAQQTNIYPDAITFHNMMGVSSGRLTPKAVYQTIQGLAIEFQSVSQRSTEIQQRQILYADNISHKGVSYYDEEFDREEIKQYLKKVKLSKDQQNSLKKYEKMSELIKSQIQTRNNIVKTKINDRKLHAQIEGKVNEDLSRLMSMDEGSLWQADKLISKNKQHKDKKINMKNHFLIDGLQRKQESDKVVKEMLKNNAGKQTKR